MDRDDAARDNVIRSIADYDRLSGILWIGLTDEEFAREKARVLGAV